MRFPRADAPLIAHGFGGAGSYTEDRPVRLTNMARRPVQNAERQANARRSLSIAETGVTSVISKRSNTLRIDVAKFTSRTLFRSVRPSSQLCRSFFLRCLWPLG